MILPSPRALVLGGAPGPELHLLDLGATVHRLVVTCGDGVRRDVVLGLPGAEEMLASTDYLGGTVGRYANRIAAGRFELDEQRVELLTNDRGNHLHGGPDGFDRRTWRVVAAEPARATLELVSADGDQGYPGEVTVLAEFVVTADRVRLELTATTNAPTIVNVTSHAYFNLHGGGSIDEHRLEVAAASYTPVDQTGIPLEDHAPVDGTPFDLRSPAELGPVVRSDHPQLASAQGIDHNYVLDGDGWSRAAVLEGPRTETRMEVWTDQPGLQVYTGNFLDGRSTSRAGSLLRQGDGIALEPQFFPDSPNRPGWPSPVLLPGEVYRSRIEWRFGAIDRPSAG
jgi:aldose 1-epimerase